MSGTWLKSLISEGLQASDECRGRDTEDGEINTEGRERSQARGPGEQTA